jgi:hypothetical protein
MCNGHGCAEVPVFLLSPDTCIFHICMYSYT